MSSLCQPRRYHLWRANLAAAWAVAPGANFVVVELTPPDYRMEALLHSRGTGEVQTIVKKMTLL